MSRRDLILVLTMAAMLTVFYCNSSELTTAPVCGSARVSASSST